MRKIWGKKSQFCGLIKFHENFIAFTDILFVHSDFLKELVLKLLVCSYSEKQFFICTIFPDQLFLNLFDTSLSICKSAACLFFDLIDIDLQNFKQIFGIVLDDGVLFLAGGDHGDADNFLNNFLADECWILVIMIFPNIAEIHFAVLFADIPFEEFFFVFYFVYEIKKFHDFKKTILSLSHSHDFVHDF